ncbi:MAG: Retron-type reverse transcriptase [Candidatus Uhrbacteria bacterium GW2011_GWA2_52_8d]|uniref:Retron-type reverse transcriptase n=1 Tax=Candidatus Uhrbacteria bacterium GW2011_GWA2_52_8d TaxID=1618979 RepID=A0A0G1XNL3_9BACT|nr:MAG: Retron-type reverse transcriptase [Candidatus Uhrbacteria bacterium GW2011_GWA2_52_8d]
MRLEDELFDLLYDLESGSYRHGRYEQFYIHDPKRRYISKASVRDRVFHQALVGVLEPAFEPSFIFVSFASRKGKGTHAAIDRLEDFLIRGSRNGSSRIYALKCDISKFFDSIQHDVLKGMLAQHIINEPLLRLVDQVVDSHSSFKGTSHGLPLGNVTSQLFANIYLNGFDHWVKERLRISSYVRFCDDFVLLHENRQFLESVLLQIESYLSQKLHLQLHSHKIFIRTYEQGVDFLGWVLRPGVRTMRTKTRRRLSQRVVGLVSQYEEAGILQENFSGTIQSCLATFDHGQEFQNQKRLINSIRQMKFKNFL